MHETHDFEQFVVDFPWAEWFLWYLVHMEVQWIFHPKGLGMKDALKPSVDRFFPISIFPDNYQTNLCVTSKPMSCGGS